MTQKPTKKRSYPGKRKSASDSLTSVKEVVAAATEVIKPCEHIDLCDVGYSYFRDIINERANADWGPHDVTMATKLAKNMALENSVLAQLEDEGPTCIGARGGVIANPVANVLKGLQSSVATMRRQLALHSAADGQIKEVSKRRGQRRAIQDAASDQAEDPLLA